MILTLPPPSFSSIKSSQPRDALNPSASPNIGVDKANSFSQSSMPSQEAATNVGSYSSVATSSAIQFYPPQLPLPAHKSSTKGLSDETFDMQEPIPRSNSSKRRKLDSKPNSLSAKKDTPTDTSIEEPEGLEEEHGRGVIGGTTILKRFPTTTLELSQSSQTSVSSSNEMPIPRVTSGSRSRSDPSPTTNPFMSASALLRAEREKKSEEETTTTESTSPIKSSKGLNSPSTQRKSQFEPEYSPIRGDGDIDEEVAMDKIVQMDQSGNESLDEDGSPTKKIQELRQFAFGGNSGEDALSLAKDQKEREKEIRKDIAKRRQEGKELKKKKVKGPKDGTSSRPRGGKQTRKMKGKSESPRKKGDDDLVESDDEEGSGKEDQDQDDLDPPDLSSIPIQFIRILTMCPICSTKFAKSKSGPAKSTHIAECSIAQSPEVSKESITKLIEAEAMRLTKVGREKEIQTEVEKSLMQKLIGENLWMEVVGNEQEGEKVEKEKVERSKVVNPSGDTFGSRRNPEVIDGEVENGSLEIDQLKVTSNISVFNLPELQRRIASMKPIAPGSNPLTKLKPKPRSRSTKRGVNSTLNVVAQLLGDVSSTTTILPINQTRELAAASVERLLGPVRSFNPNGDDEEEGSEGLDGQGKGVKKGPTPGWGASFLQHQNLVHLHRSNLILPSRQNPSLEPTFNFSQGVGIGPVSQSTDPQVLSHSQIEQNHTSRAREAFLSLYDLEGSMSLDYGPSITLVTTSGRTSNSLFSNATNFATNTPATTSAASNESLLQSQAMEDYSQVCGSMPSNCQPLASLPPQRLREPDQNQPKASKSMPKEMIPPPSHPAPIPSKAISFRPSKLAQKIDHKSPGFGLGL